MRWHEDPHSRPQQGFKIATSLANFSAQIGTGRKLWPGVRLVVVITVEHDLEAPLCHLLPQVRNEGAVFL
jgi:hypothetical protein